MDVLLFHQLILAGTSDKTENFIFGNDEETELRTVAIKLNYFIYNVFGFSIWYC